ncbi:MAG: hypothetical protein J07HQW1_00653 [Haloquadratum walsbyi J07HQW1]|uniref:Uncharacterized protein n=1 Tax=Haloquadratum walsbyi J07HQW1 TaxID=1238424 RepID=U1MLQ6_9EURY|nr:MAG: hypothetical protein J07HQW1_00653 [Haloquadratum walsbyi J07HQW1]
MMSHDVVLSGLSVVACELTGVTSISKPWESRFVACTLLLVFYSSADQFGTTQWTRTQILPFATTE